MRLAALCLVNAREMLARIGIAAAWAGNPDRDGPLPGASMNATSFAELGLRPELLKAAC